MADAPTSHLSGRSEDRTLVERALDGDRASMSRLVARLLPVVRKGVKRVVFRGRQGRGGLTADDLVQEVWLGLIAEGGRRLRAFDPERGTLEDFVIRLSEREAIDAYRKATAQKRGGAAQQAEVESLDQFAGSGADPEARLLRDELARRLRAYLAEELSERGLLVFRYVFTEERQPAEAATLMNVNVQVVYNWQHKIRALAKAFLQDTCG